MTSNWDLAFIYKGFDDPQIDEDLNQAEKIADELPVKYRGKITTGELTSQEFLDFIQKYEKIYHTISKPYAYSFLLFSQETTNEDFKALHSKMQQRRVEISNKLIWGELEIRGMDDDVANKYLDDPLLKKYHHFIKVERLKKPYLLTESEEKIIEQKKLIGVRAWEKFYNELTASFQFEVEIEGEKKILSPGEILPLIRDPRPEVREAVFKTYYQKYADNKIPITHCFNNIWKDHGQNVKLRNYPTTMMIAHIRNQTDEKIVKTMMNVIKKNAHFVQNYYKMKAKLLEQADKLKGSDLYAPIGKDIKYTWDEAKSMVLDAYTEFDPEIGEMSQKFFDNNLIDSEIRKTKMTGAYCYGINPSLDPVIHMSFNGTPDSISTLAHEMGHGLHDMLSGRKQPYLTYGPPLVVAETASVFGEQILINKLLKSMTDAEAKLKILASQLEDAIVTISRQTMYVFWEEECHDLGSQKNLSAKEMSDLWDKHVKDIYGDSVAFLPEQSWNWASIPHFLDYRIFYCYAYSFGMLFVLGLYQKFLQEGKSFIPKYKAILEAGGSQFPIDLGKSVGLDITKEEFWQGGFDYLFKLLKEFQELVEKQI